MANPVFENDPVFGDPRRRPAQRAVVAQPGVDPVTLEQMYASPSATARDTGRLTYDDVIVRTGGLLALLAVVAAATWYGTEQGFLPPGTWVVGMVVGLVLGLVNAFKRQPSPVLISLYTVAQGVFLGGISLAFTALPVTGTGTGTAQPIVLQAVLATFATFGAALWLFSSGRVRVTAKFVRWLIVAMVGYLVFQLVNVVLSYVIPSGDAFGPLRSGGWGLLVGVFAVGLAAANLIVDFDAIKRGVLAGAPRRYAWTAAFGLVVTLVW
ncbi:MAG: Bax inhibitor-1/YccA family protein, partial [Cellulomonas sp.]|nr:Bax inhibitor-1/YccA family protein [Cellulomonas sp.]